MQHSVDLEFGTHGGAELFFADIDGDGQVEILAYQGPGVFGARMYRAWPWVSAAVPPRTCLTAFRRDGTRLWSFGEPNPPGQAYLCHAHESCVSVGVVDDSGVPAVALADGARVVLLDGPSGAVRASAALPEDNYYIVGMLGVPAGAGEAVMAIKNGEGGYGAWRYGEPVMGLDRDLRTVWGPQAIPGGGHYILGLDLDRNGGRDFLIGYCRVSPHGDWRCLVDAVDPAGVDADKAHVDFTDILPIGRTQRVIGFAGSDKAYLVGPGRRTRWVWPDRHVQGCAVGRFRRDSRYQMLIYNDDGPLILVDPSGQELWRLSTSDREQWPLGQPAACRGRVFHRNRPVVRWPGRRDLAIFSDGGWPWCVDGDGRVLDCFAPPASSRQPERPVPEKGRGDDLGYGFGTQVVDWFGNGRPAAVIYDREHLWVYPEAPAAPLV
ncbi:MAG: hypothetical protein GX595_12970 [Lentisphaerae bacterium]|nr:hypothetical protein [Lentisphaerota bacterium]